VRTYEIELRELRETPAAAATASVTVAQIGQWIGAAYARVAGFLARRGLGPAGMPFARYHRTGDVFDVEAGFPAYAPVTGDEDVVSLTLPGGECAVTVHIGSYDTMEPAYAALAAWMEANDATPRGDAWEVYFSDPASEPDPTQWRTEIVQPITGR
jgi:effector-binding domain-containing protein